MKKTILFVVDKPNWAYEYMVISWLPYLLKDFDCFIIYQIDFNIVRSGDANRFYRSIFNQLSIFKNIFNRRKRTKLHTKGYFYNDIYRDKIFQFISIEGKKEIVNINNIHFDFIIEMAFYFQYISHIPFTSTQKIVGIFTDTFPHDGPYLDLKNNIDRSRLSREEFYNTYLEDYNHIIVGGGNLYDDYKKISENVSFVYGIYGEDKFQENLNVGEKQYLVIGWTGTPDRPMKGFREFIEPAIKKVNDTGREVVLKTKFSGSYEELYTFYQDVDLVIIASSADSGPSLYAEACLSSVPTISTKVGLPLMGIDHEINGLFIERSIDSIYEAILRLYDDRSLLMLFSSRVKRDYLNKLSNDKNVQNLLKLLQ